jgi:DNA repair exonuclease SbcCD ATPase subunit
MSEVEHAEARYRAEWLHKHKAPQDWLILTASEVATLSKELDTAERAHSEAMKLANAFHEDQTQLLLECNKAIQQINELTQQVEQLRSSCAEAIKDLEFRRELYKVQEQFLEKARSARNELQQKYDNLAAEHMLVVNKICNERDEAREELRTANVEANALATSIQKAEYPDAKEFELLGSVAGVISQIDNMYAGVRQQRDEAIDAMETCRRVSRKDCEQNAKRAEELHVQNLTLERERDEAREALMKIEQIFVDGEDTFEDRMAMGNIAREALEGGE